MTAKAALSRITGLRRLDNTIIRIPFQGDNWHTTWADDDEQYVLMCDGQGYNTRLWRLCGDPPDISFAEVPGYPDLKDDWTDREDPITQRYYGFGIIACGGRIYHYLSAPNPATSASGYQQPLGGRGSRYTRKWRGHPAAIPGRGLINRRSRLNGYRRMDARSGLYGRISRWSRESGPITLTTCRRLT